ncbi:NAD(P)H-dependent oxidoreductase [Streptomyces melanogenes]|uniref:NAD(P)H-dependent oxidoreductase n=1 Tax=Streptomyces melanogenes TaxID=67326 RepID=UPI0037A1A710
MSCRQRHGVSLAELRAQPRARTPGGTGRSRRSVPRRWRRSTRRCPAVPRGARSGRRFAARCSHGWGCTRTAGRALHGKKALAIYTSGTYAPGRRPAFGADFQTPYFQGWLRWSCIRDVETIEVRPGPPSGRELAHARARDLAKMF